MTDYLDLAKRAPTAKLKSRYLAEHRAEKLRSDIRHCTNCLLYRSRTNAVPWDGPHHGKAKLALVGEAPGANEDKTGVPFVGAAGRVLNQCLEAAGLAREEVAIINTLCCRPPANRDPEPDEMAACAPNFDAQLSMVGVPVGVAMGGYAAAAVLGVGRGDIRLKDVRNTVAWRHNMAWTFTYHPAYVLRNRNMAGLLVTDLKVAADTVSGLTELDISIKEISPYDIDRSLGEGVHDHLRRRGWVTVKLRRIQVTVTVVPNEKGKYRVPPKAGDYPVYTLSELMRLGIISRQHTLSPTTLRRIHEVKVGLGATLTA